MNARFFGDIDNPKSHVRKLIEAECFDTPVLSFHELMPTLRLEPLSRVGVPEAPLLEAA